MTVERFSPRFEDDYYPPEEGKERASAAPPRLVTLSADRVALAGAEGRPVELKVGQSALGWELAAILTARDGLAAVFERHFDRWGLLVRVNSSGETITIRKAIGKLKRIAPMPVSYPLHYEQAILDSRGDLLGENVLEHDGDPSFEACASLLPDLTAYTFLATEQSGEVIAVGPDGRLGALGGRRGREGVRDVAFDPRNHVPAHQPTEAKRGLAGGWLPAVDYGFFDGQTRVGWEEIAFAPLGGAGGSLHALVYLRIISGDGEADRKYFRAGAETKPIAAEEFFGQLFDLKRHWDAVMDEAMEAELPERRIVDACRASLVRAFITYEGDAPRYGVGDYAAARHATFPPATLSMVNACIEWGLMRRAGRYLDYYLDHAVLPNGAFDYYGPAVSEYGQMLDVIAKYARRSGRRDWLERKLPKIDSIVERLLALRRESQAKVPKGELRHGLIMGSPEADTRKEVGYYFSGDVWTWRGWREIGRLLVESKSAETVRRGERLLAECEAYRADIERSIERSILSDTQPPFVPPVAGFDKPFSTMTQDHFASYTNYRYWIEMLSSGFLRPQWHDAIIAYRRTHGGELLGTTRFSGHLDDWPYAGYAYGLLLRDRVRHFLLGFYGDLAVHRMRGTFTAYEQVAIRGLGRRTEMADYCVPVQLVTPLLTKWMLVFEERDADVLWLCRAAPRRWLEAGGGVSVRRASTRWGPVSFTIAPDEHESVRARVELPRGHFPAELRLRLRTPTKRPIQRMILNGRPHADLDADGQYVRIAAPAERVLELTAHTVP